MKLQHILGYEIDLDAKESFAFSSLKPTMKVSLLPEDYVVIEKSIDKSKLTVAKEILNKRFDETYS